MSLQVEEMHRARGRAEPPRPIQQATLPAPPPVHQSGSSLNPILLGFSGSFIT